MENILIAAYSFFAVVGIYVVYRVYNAITKDKSTGKFSGGSGKNNTSEK